MPNIFMVGIGHLSLNVILVVIVHFDKERHPFKY